MKSHFVGRLITILVCALALTMTAAAQLQVTPHSQEMFTLTPASSSAVRPLVIDAAPRVRLSVTALHKTLAIALISPAGTRYTFGTNAPNFESSVFAYDDPSGANYHAALTNPTAGTWQLEVGAPGITAPLQVVVNVIPQNRTGLVLIGGGQTAPTGSSTPLALAAFDGTTRLHALTIVARAHRPDGSSAPIAFLDNGASPDAAANDGIFTTSLSTSAAGEYEVSVDVRGTASTGSFRRTGNATIRAVPQTAVLDGTFTDNGFDDNADGLLDGITVAPRMNVSEGGTFDVALRLRSASGRTIQRSISMTSSVGPATAPIRFDADSILRDLAENGPYAVSLVEVEHRRGPADVGLVDRRIDLGMTKPYTLTQFQRDRLRLSGSGTATPIDFNNNGRYDQLKISLGITAEVAGFYTYSGTLTASNGATLGVSGSSRSLPAGTSNLDFTFAGLPIGENGVDGPYDLSILIFGAGQSLLAPKAFVTEAYPVWKFEGAVARDVTPPTLSVSVTPTELWPANHQMIEITPTISVQDDFDTTPTVTLDSIVSNEGQDAHGDGHTSVDIEIDATGRIFLRAERSGTGTGRIYTLTWSARDDAGNVSTATATVTVPHDQKK